MFLHGNGFGSKIGIKLIRDEYWVQGVALANSAGPLYGSDHKLSGW